jgi:Zn-dependent protease with chaperone function
VTVGVALVLYAALAGVVGPIAVRRAGWPLRAPRLGATAVLALAWSVPLALVLAGMTLALPASSLTIDIGHLIGACLNRLRAAYGSPRGAAVVLTGQALSLAVLTRVLWAAARLVVSRRTERRRHRLLIRLAGRPMPEASAVVLDSPAAAAYSIAGRHPAVVVTSGVVDALSAQQLDAVLAHEQAHLQARHHRRLSAAAVAARSLPFVPLLRDTPGLTARLLEMEADQLAADRHEPRVLASALVAVATAGPGVAAVPRHGTSPGVAGGDAAARIRRLLHPPEQLPRRPRTMARAGAIAVTMGPVLLATLPGLLAVR